MLIDRQFVLAVGEGSEIGAEPMGKGRHNSRYLLASRETPAAQGCTAAARVIGNGHRESLVFGCGPQRGLAAPRMSNDCNLPGINLRNGLEIVQNSACA